MKSDPIIVKWIDGGIWQCAEWQGYYNHMVWELMWGYREARLINVDTIFINVL